MTPPTIHEGLAPTRPSVLVIDRADPRSISHQRVLNHTRGLKCLILGGTPIARIKDEVRDAMEFTDVLWPECKRGDTPAKVNHLICKVDFLLLKVMHLTHSKAPGFRELAKQHGVKVINCDSDGINRTVENFHQHLCQPLLLHTDEQADALCAPDDESPARKSRKPYTYRNDETRSRVGRRRTPTVEAAEPETEQEATSAADDTLTTQDAAPAPSVDTAGLRAVRDAMLAQKEPRDAELASLAAEEQTIAARLRSIEERRGVIANEDKGTAERIYAIEQLLLVFEGGAQ